MMKPLHVLHDGLRVKQFKEINVKCLKDVFEINRLKEEWLN